MFQDMLIPDKVKGYYLKDFGGYDGPKRGRALISCRSIAIRALFPQTDGLPGLGRSNFLHQPGHILTEGFHGAQSLLIFQDLADIHAHA